MKFANRIAMLAAVSTLCLAGFVTATASAALPGKNGRLLAYAAAPANSIYTGMSLLTLNADGSSRLGLFNGGYFNPGEFFTPNGLVVAHDPGDSFSVDPKTLVVRPFPSVEIPGWSTPVDEVSPDGSTLLATNFGWYWPSRFNAGAPDPNGIWIQKRGSDAVRVNLPSTIKPREAAFTPNGKRLVIVADPTPDSSAPSTQTSRLFVSKLDGSGLRKVAEYPGLGGISVSPDSHRVIFSVHRTVDDRPVSDIYGVELDGSGSRALTTDGVSSQPVYSPDGMKIAFNRRDVGEQSGIWTMGVDGSDLRQVAGGPAPVPGVSDWGRDLTFKVGKYKFPEAKLRIRTWNPGTVSVEGPRISGAVRRTKRGVVEVPVRPNARTPEGTKTKITVTFKPKGALKSVKKRVIELG